MSLVPINFNLRNLFVPNTNPVIDPDTYSDLLTLRDAINNFAGLFSSAFAVSSGAVGVTGRVTIPDGVKSWEVSLPSVPPSTLTALTSFTVPGGFLVFVYVPNVLPAFPQFHAMCHIIHDGGGARMIQVINNTGLTLSFASDTLSATQVYIAPFDIAVKVLRIF
jgi:hypothetical protein